MVMANNNGNRRCMVQVQIKVQKMHLHGLTWCTNVIINAAKVGLGVIWSRMAQSPNVFDALLTLKTVIPVNLNIPYFLE